jgi:hypothetical protein
MIMGALVGRLHYPLRSLPYFWEGWVLCLAAADFPAAAADSAALGRWGARRSGASVASAWHLFRVAFRGEDCHGLLAGATIATYELGRLSTEHSREMAAWSALLRAHRCSLRKARCSTSTRHPVLTLTLSRC